MLDHRAQERRASRATERADEGPVVFAGGAAQAAIDCRGFGSAVERMDAVARRFLKQDWLPVALSYREIAAEFNDVRRKDGHAPPDAAVEPFPSLNLILR
jgi:hypothetical protein